MEQENEPMAKGASRMIRGLDCLGLAHGRFPLKLIAEELPKGWGIGVFDHPFGRVIKRLRHLLKLREELGLPPLPAVRIHAWWDSLHSHKEAIIPIKKFKLRLPDYEQLSKDFPGMKVFVSFTCEYNCTNKIKVDARIKATRELAPSCIPVQSCMIGYFSPNELREKHGSATSDIASTDGVDIWDINARLWMQKNKNSKMVLGWCHSMNGREKGKPPLPFKERTKFVSRTEIKKIVTLMGD